MTESTEPLDTDRLRHVLLWAIRELLVAKGLEPESVKTAGLGRLRELVSTTTGVTQAEIDHLYEEYRYGTRPTFYLYLLPPGAGVFAPSNFEGAMEAQDHSIESDDDNDAALAVDTVTVQDWDQFDSIDEVRLSYLHPHHYIDEDGNPAVLQELRYAFVWVDTLNQFAVVVTRDKAVCGPVVRGLSSALGVTPFSPLLSQASLSRIVRAEDAARVRFVSADGIGRSYTGMHKADVTARLAAHSELDHRRISGDQQRGGLYAEILGEKRGALGISATQGKLYLTLTLSLQELRGWSIQRLKPIIRAVKRDEATSIPITKNMYSVAGLSADVKVSFRELLRSVIIASKLNRSSSLTGISLEELLAAFGKQAHLKLLVPCEVCDMDGIVSCSHCGDSEVDVIEDRVRCSRCEDDFAPHCDAGHLIKSADLMNWILVSPNDALRRSLIERTKGNAGLDRERGYIVFWHNRTWTGNSLPDQVGVINIELREGAQAAVNVNSPGATAIYHKE